MKDALSLFGIKSDIALQIETSFSSNSKQIQAFLNKMKLTTVEYENVEWRLDIKLGSKSLRKIVEPEILLKFDFRKGRSGLSDGNDGDNIETKLLQTDIVNLNNLTNSLENALNEIRTNYCRRVFRNAL